jgi:fructosamine-3-kinase
MVTGMSVGASDISWQVLGEIVRDWAGNAAKLIECKPLVGGYIHTTLLLLLADGSRAVLKISPHRVDRAYLDEAHQLQFLRQMGVPTPQVFRTQIGSLDRPHSYILMEFIPGTDLSHARKQCSTEQYDQLQTELGDLVAMIHNQTASLYQRHLISRQEIPCQDWPTFFRDIYDRIWREADKNAHLPMKVRKKISKIHASLENSLSHDDVPRLTHWDLWCNNLLAAADDDGHWHIAAFLDPNSKYAHAEAEIAYLELFQTVTPAFMKAYQKHHKLSADYHRVRKLVYQMYPLIDHVNLFGQEYVGPLCHIVDKLDAVV